MVDIIIVALIVVAMFFAGKRALKQFKGEETCCGSTNNVISKDKVLEGNIIGKKVVKIKGMHCENCASKVKNAINTIDGASAIVNLSKNEAIVSYDREINDNDIKQAVSKAGYSVV